MVTGDPIRLNTARCRVESGVTELRSDAAARPANRSDVIVVGGGQAALAVCYYLRRANLTYVVLDDQTAPGGAWQHTWRSLRLFSPAQWSSLPGRFMPGGSSYYPTRDEALAYLADYEVRYAVPVHRPVHVVAVSGERRDFVRVHTESSGDWLARAVVSATGTWSMPNVPHLPGQDRYGGIVLHSARYASAEPFEGRRVVVVGGGNSGAQIVADLFERSTVTWATLVPPTFLPDDVDGRYLFGEASARYRAMTEGGAPIMPRSLGDIVMVESVRRARDRGALNAVPMFSAFVEDGVVWADGRRTREDAVIFATGFKPALAHRAPLGVFEPNGRIAVRGTRSVREPRLWLVGYGDWTGYASATLIGVGRTARATVDEIVGALGTDV